MSNTLEPYNPQQQELSIQEYWEKQALYKAITNSSSSKYYCLDMFPYPSGNGLHVGHPEGYTATDIFSRYQRMHGYNVLHPMGWDAFGLPAENYAIKTGVHPDQSTHENIKNFTRQIKSLGFSYDWDREIDTSSPEYYKWTQWIFLQMYQHGLAYRKQAKVNWCETCQTVLANEQVVDGKCDRSKDLVIQKDLKQWFFKITDYADRLLNDLDNINWPEPIKLMQRNWISKKSGVVIKHQVKDLDITLETFSAYPAWLFADTFLVMAPEHPIVQKLVQDTAYEKDVRAFVDEVQKTTTAERGDANREKKGVFTGRYAINPFTGDEMPIWLANFALMDFGTGIIRCSAHDSRDYEFAQKYHLSLREVVKRTNAAMPVNAHDNTGVLRDSGPFTNRAINEQLIKDMLDWIEIENIGHRQVTYRLRDWLISRQRYWGAPIPIVYDPDGNPHPVKEEHLPLLLPTDVDYLPKGTSPLGSSKSYRANAEELYGKGWYFEVDTMDTFVCSSWYYLRFCDPHNTKEFASQEALSYWLPVDMYVGGAEHAVLHLLYARFFHKALQDFGHIPKVVGNEPFKALRNQGMILGEDHQKMSKSLGNVINPDEIIEEFGADTMRLYEMFMGPFEDVKPWNTESIKGIRRFLERVWNVYKTNNFVFNTTIPNPANEIAINQTIKKVQEDIENFRFNTAISQLMICSNEFQSEGSIINTEIAITFLQILYPFAPHITETLRIKCNFTEEIFNMWPTYNPELLIKDEVKIAIQVNGKRRDELVINQSDSEDEAIVKSAALDLEGVKRHIENKAIIKFIYVPKKIVNIVVK